MRKFTLGSGNKTKKGEKTSLTGENATNYAATGDAGQPETVLLTGGNVQDQHPGEGTSSAAKAKMASCCATLVSCLSTIGTLPGRFHRWGGTPGYHTTGSFGLTFRKQHYLATAVWTTGAILTVMGLTNYFDTSASAQEKQWWAGEKLTHQIFAGINFLLISIAAGVAGALIHARAQGLEGVPQFTKDLQQAGKTLLVNEAPETIQLQRSGSAVKNAPSEDQGVLPEVGASGESDDDSQASRYCTPRNTGIAVFSVMVIGFVVGSFLNPDLFNAIADSDYGHVGAAVSTAVAVGGLAALFQFGIVKAANSKCCERKQSEDEDMNEYLVDPTTTSFSSHV